VTARVAELTGLINLTNWPTGLRVIVRKERPHPGAQLRFTDRDGLRLTVFATNTRHGQLADLQLRHRRRARCEDRIRTAKDTGLTNLPLPGGYERVWRLLDKGHGQRDSDGAERSRTVRESSTECHLLIWTAHQLEVWIECPRTPQ
jgi:hypothetical protein